MQNPTLFARHGSDGDAFLQIREDSDEDMENTRLLLPSSSNSYNDSSSSNNNNNNNINDNNANGEEQGDGDDRPRWSSPKSILASLASNVRRCISQRLPLRNSPQIYSSRKFRWKRMLRLFLLFVFSMM